MKKLVMVFVMGAVLSGCSVDRNASDYTLCQQMSGDTFYSGSDAASVMRQRLQNGTATISPEQCAQIAQQNAAQWQQSAANLTAASNAYNQQLQAQQVNSRPVNTTCNPTINGGMQCSTF